MIQILGIRRYIPKGETKEKSFETFFDKKWRAPSVADLFKNIENYLVAIPEAERFNLYFTCADCLEIKGRKISEAGQSILPFDIDGIDVEKRQQYISVVCRSLGIDPTKTGILFSGNGLQFFIQLKTPILSNAFFDTHRIFYKAVCSKVNKDIQAAGLVGAMDSSVFTPARLMRLPLTENRKPNKPTRMGELYYRNIVPVDFDLVTLSGIPMPKNDEQIPLEEIKKYPPADTQGVLTECLFLKHCAEVPDKIPEDAWYAMLSITARLQDGNKLSHELSAGHPGYSVAQCEEKISHALAASGPRTCANIQKLWGKCGTCVHHEKIKSPILIKSESFIATEAHGFHNYSERGKGTPNFEDLRRFFQKKMPYISLDGAHISYAWTGTHWKQLTDSFLETFAYTHFRPHVKSDVRREFKDLINITNLRDPFWFEQSTFKKINFENGVLDLEQLEKGLLPHDPAYGFRNVLPYRYEPGATAEVFKKFLSDVTREDQSLQKILLEFAGYAFSNDDCWNAKALILIGDGANGKSTFLNVLYDLAGKDQYSTLSLDDLRSETARQMMDGKLFNASEETPTYSLMDSSVFKNVVSGGEMRMRQLYKSAYTVRNRCKFIFACNDLPFNRDTSYGLYRRLLIVPFDAVFEEKACDPHIQKKLKAELPGIFNLVLEGYQRLEKQKVFTSSELVSSHLAEYKKTSDTVEMFFDDNVSVVDNLSKFSGVFELYAAFKFYAEQRGFKAENYRVFVNRIRKIIPDYKSRVERRVVQGKKCTVIKGISYDEIKMH